MTYPAQILGPFENLPDLDESIWGAVRSVFPAFLGYTYQEASESDYPYTYLALIANHKDLKEDCYYWAILFKVTPHPSGWATSAMLMTMDKERKFFRMVPLIELLPEGFCERGKSHTVLLRDKSDVLGFLFWARDYVSRRSPTETGLSLLV